MKNMGLLDKLLCWKKRTKKIPTTEDGRLYNLGPWICVDANVCMDTTVKCSAYTQTQKLKCRKKKTENTPSKEDGAVFNKDRRICVDAELIMDQTVMCCAYTQTQTTVISGDAVIVKYERELELKNQRIRQLEEELAISNRLFTDLMLHIKSMEEQLKKYAEMPVISWCDECECKEQVPTFTDLCEKFTITDFDAENTKTDTTSSMITEFDSENPTEAKSTQRDCARPDEQATGKRMSVSVKEYERKFRLLNEEIERLLDDPFQFDDIKSSYEEGNRRQAQKIREMRDELNWCKEQLLASQSREDILQTYYMYFCRLKSEQQQRRRQQEQWHRSQQQRRRR
jgi:hypothetical protein